MKTLDEVITGLDICKNFSYCTHPQKGECPYLYEDNSCGQDDLYKDALHYLKTIETTETLYHDAVNKLSKWEDEDWKDRCLPLTWDELKQMEGKPIWLEYDNHLSGRKQIKYKIWEVIDLIIEDMILVKGGFNYQKNEFGDVWQAYRKENNGR